MHDPDVLLLDLRWVEIWHREPHGRDSGTVCRGGSGKWHPHHWRLNSLPLRRFRRRLLTRCEWCGGRDKSGDPVNVSHGGRKRGPWWRGETGLLHQDCHSVQQAHRLCYCEVPVLDLGDHGQCLACEGYRAWRKAPTDLDRAMASLPHGSRRPQWITNELQNRHTATRKEV